MTEKEIENLIERYDAVLDELAEIISQLNMEGSTFASNGLLLFLRLKGCVFSDEHILAERFGPMPTAEQIAFRKEQHKTRRNKKVKMGVK